MLNELFRRKSVERILKESESQKMVMLPGTDGNWTKSTFDVLIAALKQNRASARR